MDKEMIANAKTYQLRQRKLELLDMDRQIMTSVEFEAWQNELDAINAEILNRA